MERLKQMLAAAHRWLFPVAPEERDSQRYYVSRMEFFRAPRPHSYESASYRLAMLEKENHEQRVEIRRLNGSLQNAHSRLTQLECRLRASVDVKRLGL